MTRAEKRRQNKKTRNRILAREWIRDLLIAALLALIVMQFIKPTIVQQHSMEPNFYSGDYLFVSKQAYNLFGGTPQLGDVIVFKSAMKTEEGEDKLLIKRVIGTPGDVITIKDGTVFVNGEAIDDSYTKDQYTNGNVTDLVVPADSYYCLGDNRLSSADSRDSRVGFVFIDSIVGKAVFRIYPFNVIGKIENPYAE